MLCVGNPFSDNDTSAKVCTMPKYYGLIAYFTSQDTPSTYNESDVISLPIYTSSERDRIVARLDVPCGDNPSQWLQCGAALFLNTK